jgi:hypothetical protein
MPAWPKARSSGPIFLARADGGTGAGQRPQRMPPSACRGRRRCAPAIVTGRACATRRCRRSPRCRRVTYRVAGNVSQGIYNMRSGPERQFPLVVSIPAGATGLLIGKCRRAAGSCQKEATRMVRGDVARIRLQPRLCCIVNTSGWFRADARAVAPARLRERGTGFLDLDCAK